MKYRITFSDGPDGNLSKHYDVEADSSDDALRMAYQMPEGKQYRTYSMVGVMEIPNGPKIIGVRFAYTQAGRPYCQHMLIKALNESQAKKYYQQNIQGKHFFQPWPDKPDPDGNCVYGEIKETYFAYADGYDFNAMI